MFRGNGRIKGVVELPVVELTSADYSKVPIIFRKELVTFEKGVRIDFSLE